VPPNWHKRDYPLIFASKHLLDGAELASCSLLSLEVLPRDFLVLVIVERVHAVPPDNGDPYKRGQDATSHRTPRLGGPAEEVVLGVRTDSLATEVGRRVQTDHVATGGDALHGALICQYLRDSGRLLRDRWSLSKDHGQTGFQVPLDMAIWTFISVYAHLT